MDDRERDIDSDLSRRIRHTEETRAVELDFSLTYEDEWVLLTGDSAEVLRRIQRLTWLQELKLGGFPLNSLTALQSLNLRMPKGFALCAT